VFSSCNGGMCKKQISSLTPEAIFFFFFLSSISLDFLALPYNFSNQPLSFYLFWLSPCFFGWYLFYFK
jgi:hypothetical protein